MNRILITVDPTGPGWSYQSTLARALAKRGNEVKVVAFGVAPSADRRSEMEQDGVELSHVPLNGPTTDPVFVSAARQALQMLVEEWAPAIVQIDRCSFGDLDLHVPKVLAVAADRTVRISRGRGPARKGLLGADAVISPTRALADEIARRFEYRRPITVIQPGIEMGETPVNISVTRRQRNGVMFYGRTDEKGEGFDLVLDAARKISGANEGALRLSIGGEGVRPPLPGFVQDLGWMDSADRLAAFGKADIAVLPTREEPFGLVSAEAALAGCALLLSDIPTHHELWHGAAVLVPPDDGPAFTEALQALLADPRKREDCARLCRARALSGFGADRLVEEHLDVYRRIKRTWAKKAGGPPRLSEDVMPLS